VLAAARPAKPIAKVADSTTFFAKLTVVMNSLRISELQT
jgi:hypothetical protein